MYISQLYKTWLLTTSCASILLFGGVLTHAQSAGSIDFLYVSPQGNDAWSGQSPTANAGDGPFQTLTHARDAVTALADSGLARPVEVVFDPGVCSPQDFLSRWFTASPNSPVIWHSDPSRTVLIYTRTTAEQNDALSAEDYMNAAGEGISRFYVSPSGSDAWSGRNPSAEGDNGPFQSLSRAQEAVDASEADTPNVPVEVVIEDGSAVTPGFLKLAAMGTAKKARVTSKRGAAASAKVVGRGLPTKTVAVVANSKLVFAHYVMACRDYGGSIAGYERDIQDAQAAGVDGFALNCGSWNAANYKIDTASMFQAAHALNTGFKLFFSIDEGGGSVSPAEIQNMIHTYANDPSYYHYQGCPLLSTWGGDGGTPAANANFWMTSVLTPLRSAGYNIYFVPQFANYTPPLNTLNGLSTLSQVQAGYQTWWKTAANSASFLDGLFEVSLAPPLNYAYSRTVPAVPVVAGHQGGLTVWDAHWDHFYDSTNEFTGDDIGRTITIAGNANFTGGTYLISHLDGGYPVSNSTGKALGSHNLITLIMTGSSPAKHSDATGGGYTVQSQSSVPQEGSSLLAQETYAQTMQANGKPFMSSVSPQYWGSLRSDVGRCYNEFCGGEGLAAQWKSIINVQKPDWIELFTWNDFAEDTYFSPIDDVAKYWPYTLPGTNNNVLGYMQSHAGFTALNKYYINWYKSGVQPAITGDSVYYFYRTQPMNMVATNDPRGPVTQRSGPIADVIYVTAMLSSAATLQVSSGPTSQTFSLPAGTSTLHVPFSSGSQTFTLLRNGQTVVTKQGTPIVASAPAYNFGVYSGSMSK